MSSIALQPLLDVMNQPISVKNSLPRDRNERKRTVPMQVMNLSFPRTGTMSVQRALRILGLKAWHSRDLFKRIEDADMWIEAQDAKFFNRGEPYTRKEWDQLLGDYSAVSADLPASFFAEDLVRAYPEAKVILIERDIESWAKSFEEYVIPAFFRRSINLISDWDPLWLGKYRDVQRRWKDGVFKAKSPDEMRAKMRDIYCQHYALVRRVTPKDRLLEFDLKDGWEPLCKFLGKQIPDVPFPRINDAVSLNEQFRQATKIGAKNIVKKYAPWILAVLAAGSAIWLLM